MPINPNGAPNAGKELHCEPKRLKKHYDTDPLFLTHNGHRNMERTPPTRNLAQIQPTQAAIENSPAMARTQTKPAPC